MLQQRPAQILPKGPGSFTARLQQIVSVGAAGHKFSKGLNLCRLEYILVGSVRRVFWATFRLKALNLNEVDIVEICAPAMQ